MAFNWQTFKTRALTAIVFVAVMMVGLLWNQWSFFILFSIVHFGAWWEYHQLAAKINPEYASVTTGYKICLMIAGWCLLLFFSNQQLQITGAHFTSIGWWLGLAMLVIVPLVLIFQSAKNYFFKNIAHSLFGIFYISVPIGLLIDLRTRWTDQNIELNLIIPLLIIFTLWVNDTMAYIVGSLIGKTPFSPISPKKTWEGTIGGVILAVVVMSLIAYFTKKLSMTHTAIIAALASISGTYGDLFESKLKRMAGVKDSGSLMPGHGGFLDRFDSLLFAVTVVWFYVVIFM
jgi:phosphatidate cytidylyltransferase